MLNRDWPPDPIRPAAPSANNKTRRPPPESAFAFGFVLGSPFVTAIVVLLVPHHPIQAWAVLPGMLLVALLIFLISGYIRLGEKR